MKRLRKLILSPQMASWADQLAVSGANLAIVLIVARWATIADVGFYAVGFSLLVMAATVQDALVTRPYAVQMFKVQSGAPQHAAGSLVFALLLAGGLAGLAALLGAGFAAAGLPDTVTRFTFAMAIAIPPTLLREFARSLAFAHLAPSQALAADLVASLLAIAGIGLLAMTGNLTALNALLALALGSSLAALGWLFCRRQDFDFDRKAARETIRRSFVLGKWLLSHQLALKSQGYAAHWITLAIGGAAVTGLYTACLSIVALTNPFLFGYFNILTPKYVRVLKDEGLGALRRNAMLGALFVGVVTGGFALGIALFGSSILNSMFPGESYKSGADVLFLLAAASAAGAVGGPAGVALMAVEKGRPLAALSTTICILGSALVLLLMWQGGLAAAAIGIFVTEVLGSLSRWALLFGLTRMASTGTASRTPAAVLN